jgi:septal ring factor EnvC (AmiA/AmiB activator)
MPIVAGWTFPVGTFGIFVTPHAVELVTVVGTVIARFREVSTIMSDYTKAFAVVVLSVLGIWGCAQGPTASASLEKIKQLEQKITRLEDDFRAATAARDQFRKKLTEAERLVADLRAEVEALRPVVAERDELRNQLKVRTAERDQVTQQFESFRKSLKELVGQMESATKPQPGVTTVSNAKNSNR